MKKTRKRSLPRNALAIHAHMRNSSGPMRNKAKSKKRNKKRTKDFLLEKY